MLTPVPLFRCRSSIYAMFDLLLLLSEGRTMYFGPASYAVGFKTREPTRPPLTLLATSRVKRISHLAVRLLSVSFHRVRQCCIEQVLSAVGPKAAWINCQTSAPSPTEA